MGQSNTSQGDERDKATALSMGPHFLVPPSWLALSFMIVLSAWILILEFVFAEGKTAFCSVFCLLFEWWYLGSFPCHDLNL